MNKRALFVAMLAAGLGTATLPATAETVEDMSFSGMWNLCDSDKNGAVTKAEFLTAMGKAYDAHMKKMKSMPDGGKMMKGEALTADGLRALFRATYPGP
ncbi:MAG: hypothetical protein KIT17_04665 [Rubrivivax sp.]|nr:hypothetical protein [Rubrivivax sp.]